jgi:hypothetical protein
MTRQIEKVGKVINHVGKAHTFMREREEFCTRLVSMLDGTKGRRVYGMWLQGYSPLDPRPKKTYVVYLYGGHYPAYVWDEEAQAWFGNKTKWSRTTTKYMQAIRPKGVSHWFECEDMKRIAKLGIGGFIEWRMKELGR